MITNIFNNYPSGSNLSSRAQRHVSGLRWTKAWSDPVLAHLRGHQRRIPWVSWPLALFLEARPFRCHDEQDPVSDTKPQTITDRGRTSHTHLLSFVETFCQLLANVRVAVLSPAGPCRGDTRHMPSESLLENGVKLTGVTPRIGAL